MKHYCNNVKNSITFESRNNQYMKNKTKPFNLEDAINGKKIVTRDGEVVTDFKHFNINSSHCIYAVVRYQVKSFTINGHYITDCVKCDIDLLIEE